MESSYHNRGVAVVLLRTFGLLHLAFAVFGLWLVVPHLLTRDPSMHAIDPSMPYAEHAFLVRSGVNVVFLLVEVLAGICLIKMRETGIRISNFLFISMILYFLADQIILITGDGPIRRSISITAAAGEIGTTWQFLTGYPVIALVVLNLLRRKLRQKASPVSTEPAASQTASP